MEVVIKSLNPEACDTIDEVYGHNWRVERKEFYEDEIKVYDVLVNLDYVTIEVDKDDLWLRRACDDYAKINRFDFLEIVIR